MDVTIFNLTGSRHPTCPAPTDKSVKQRRHAYEFVVLDKQQPQKPSHSRRPPPLPPPRHMSPRSLASANRLLESPQTVKTGPATSAVASACQQRPFPPNPPSRRRSTPRLGNHQEPRTLHNKKIQLETSKPIPNQASGALPKGESCGRFELPTTAAQRSRAERREAVACAPRLPSTAPARLPFPHPPVNPRRVKKEKSCREAVEIHLFACTRRSLRGGLGISCEGREVGAPLHVPRLEPWAQKR